MESKTPRTDDREFAAIDLKPSWRVVYASFTRQLETELANANELLLKTNQAHIENQQLRKDLDGEREINQRLTDELAESEKKAFAYKTAFEQSEAELIDVRAEIERKDKLIEQMRTALKMALKADPCPAKDYWRTVETEHHRGECWHAKAQAAMSAAERGEGL